MKPKKTICYEDALNDEFSGTKIKRVHLPSGFKYTHRCFLFRGVAWFVYFCIARPILWVVGQIWMAPRVKGRKNIRAIRKTGAFFYGNHTSFVDAWAVQCFISPKRGYIVANQDSTSIKGLRTFIQMLGCIPLPETKEEHESFVKCIEVRRKQKCNIIVYPEAHIWPYCTRIRPFKDDSFVYPAQTGSPVVAICTTYRERAVFKNLSPKMTIHVSKPFYPNMDASIAERKADLRKKAYDFMIDVAGDEENVEWIRYVKSSGNAKKRD